jgi:hypothetical protein
MDKFINTIILLKARAKRRILKHIEKEKAYIRKLLFPLKLFPIKLLLYFIYYPIKILFYMMLWLVKSVLKAVIWPFRSLFNFIKTIVWLTIVVYIFFSLVVISDYVYRNYGHYDKFFCGLLTPEGYYNKKVVRIIGGISQGSGFFIEENKVLTNFHVIADEPSPKIVFQGGSFTTPIKVEGERDSDLAILYTKEKYPNMVLKLANPVKLYDDEPLITVGYALGTDISGDPTNLRGKFIAFRPAYLVRFIQSDISLVRGMSGGPLLDRCGNVVGVNTLGISGISLFIASDSVLDRIKNFSDKDIAKIVVDLTTPEGTVKAFYTYLKARNMEEGFKLLSSYYLTKTNFQEWTNRFNDVLDVRIYDAKLQDKKTNTVFVKFSTQNWVIDSLVEHFYEGTWQLVKEDGAYKLNKSNIKEVNPTWDWFYVD